MELDKEWIDKRMFIQIYAEMVLHLYTVCYLPSSEWRGCYGCTDKSDWPSQKCNASRRIKILQEHIRRKKGRKKRREMQEEEGRNQERGRKGRSERDEEERMR